jgi:2-octaprenyl-6-methoxyphenol hydroxylase
MSDVAKVVIVGGGPVGAALALALSGSGLEVMLLEARLAEERASDPRPLALSYGSRLILERLGVWEALAPVTAIDRIHISQKNGFGRVALSAAEAKLPALGYVADYTQLHATLHNALQDRGPALRYVTGANVTAIRDAPASSVIEFTAGGIPHTVTASLVVAADGGTLEGVAELRSVDYRQSALTTRIHSELPHRNTAFERFTVDGPIALLPTGNDLALVWSAKHEQAEHLRELAPAEFVVQLERHFGKRLGALSMQGRRSLFPLGLRYATQVTKKRAILIGNAAQTLHPVAGQGFNLGLRDAWELAEEAQRSGYDALGEPGMLTAYAARRRLDRRGGIWFTDSLVRMFSNDIAPLRLARGAGLTLLGCVPPLKNFVVRRMTFGARG